MALSSEVVVGAGLVGVVVLCVPAMPLMELLAATWSLLRVGTGTKPLLPTTQPALSMCKNRNELEEPSSSM